MPQLEDEAEFSTSNIYQDDHSPPETSLCIKLHKDHPAEQIVGDYEYGVQTRSKSTTNLCFFISFLSIIEPKKVEEALADDDCIEAMQAELTEFERNKVWSLVPAPKGKTIIGFSGKIWTQMVW